MSNLEIAIKKSDYMILKNMSKLRGSYCIYLVMFIVLFNACKTQKSIESYGFQNSFLSIKGIECVEIKNPNAIDSQVGTIECGDITFSYDYGRYSNQGPITPKEEFRRSFDAYHHIKFFENRMIDPKVYKLFLDSVRVIDARPKSKEDKLMFDCEPCNTTAEITFKGDTYFFPLTLNEKQLNKEGYTSTIEEKDGFAYKYYQEEGSLPGLYITPIKNRFKKKNTLSLIVKKTTLTQSEVNQILKKVHLKPE